ncbi:MAG: BTAD domain-containing putative transcriptional regulator [Rhizomicrobium sp.]
MLKRTFQEPEFRVCCLGGLKLVEAGSGTDMTPASRKARALIGYLCIAGKPVGRERLAALLWGDRGEEQARASLRQAIYELRSLLGGDHLLRVERDTVAVCDDVGTDVAAITAAAQSGNLDELTKALSEWRGDFFEDLPSIDPSFDAWLQSERVRVQERLVDLAAEAVTAGMARGEIELARRIVNLLQQRDGTNEVVLRLGLRLDRLAGDSTALHRRYGRFRELLKSELDAAPAAETQRLFQELAAGSFAAADMSGSEGRVADGVKKDVQNNGDKQPPPPAGTLTVQSIAGAASETRAAWSPIRSGRRIGVAAAAATAVCCLCVLVWAVWSPLHKAADPKQEPLLAVLPFQNLSADPGSRYFSDGITGEIVDALLRITQIRVASPGSSFHFRNASAPSAAKALAATHVLSGSVERTGDRVHVIARLIDIRDNSIIWGRTYDRAIVQTPALQQDIAVQIADALDMRLSPGALNEAQHVSPAAYDHYLKGRDLFLQRDLNAAAAELDASIRLAPNFARAWSTLASVRSVLVNDMFFERNEDDVAAMEKSVRAAAQRALALDPNNGEALAVLAQITPSTQLPEIDRLFERSLRSEPNNTQLLNWYGLFLIDVGRNRDALDELTRAYEMDRVTPAVATTLVIALLETGRFEDARDIIDLNRDNRLRGLIFHLQAEYFLFRQDWSGLANYLNALPDYLSPGKAAFFRLCRETAIALAAKDANKNGQLRASWRTGGSLEPEDAVQFLSALGDADGALEVVQSAVRSVRNDALLMDPNWDTLYAPSLAPLRRDPRVPALFAQWGLFDYWRTTNHWPDFCLEPGLPFDCRAEARTFMQRVGTQAGKRH